MRPLVSRLSQGARSIALDQSSKLLHQNRVASRSPLIGVLRLPAQRASSAPNYFARYQIRAQHTISGVQTTGTYKKNKTPLGKHYGTPITTGEIHGNHYGVPIAPGKVHSELKPTDQPSQIPNPLRPSAHLFAEKELLRNFHDLIQEHKATLRREKGEFQLKMKKYEDTKTS
uniref:WGS project CBMI000000000 data, contig CS3069_c000854 n=1 Tax=Fusarium clavum TaxID=2594811 RepID=A0A090MHA1_9HYPO|nr:unnamed protein product [Fusarium clavum]